MKLSFIIPAYNEEMYIGKCLESILNEIKGKPQNKFEIIVVNNASKDRTREVALSYPGVIVLDEYKKGVVRARQTGYLAATGDLLANIDSDAIMPAGWTDTVFQRFKMNPNLVALSGPYTYYDQPRYVNWGVHLSYYLGCVISYFNKLVFGAGSILQGGNYVLKRSALQKMNGYDTSIDFYGEDTATACLMEKAGDVVFTFKLPILTSGRRFAKEGVITTGYHYAINYLWIFKRPFTNTYADVRLDPKNK